MKKIVLILSLVAIVSFGIFGSASAITFSPPDPGLIPLSAGYNYTWGIDWTIEPEAYIQSATLTFRGLFNNDISVSNTLYIHLLDAVPLAGVTRTVDTRLPGNPYALGIDTFAGQGILIAAWADTPPGGIANRSDVSFTFNASERSTLTDYLHNGGNFGFGFSPECSFYSSDVTFEMQAVPEPTTLILLGSGLASLGLFGRRKLKKGKV